MLPRLSNARMPRSRSRLDDSQRHMARVGRKRAEAGGARLWLYDCIRTELREWCENRGIINFCTSPPSILVDAKQCYVAPVNGERAAEMFSASTDQHMTHLWQHGMAVQGERSNGARLFVPNLMSVYPDGVAPLATEEDGFREHGTE